MTQKLLKRENLTKIPKLLTNNIKILIVEDEILLAMAMKSTLNEFGYLISGIETTGKNAIEHVKTEHPNLIFMDINLKGLMTGIEAAKYIWEKIGEIQTDVDLSGYVTTEVFEQQIQQINTKLAVTITAENVKTSTGTAVVVNYTIPSNLYDNMVTNDNQDQIIGG